MKNLVKIIATLLLATMLFTACGKGGNTNTPPTVPANNQATAEAPAATEAPLDPASFVQKGELKDYTILGQFHEGMTFVGKDVVSGTIGADTNDTSIWAIDKIGKKLCKLPNGYRPASRWDKGFALVENANVRDYLCVIDTTGKIVISPEQQGFTGMYISTGYYDGPNGASSLEEGVVLVYKQGENYQGITYEFGVLNTKGEWVIPLLSNDPISKTILEDGNLWGALQYKPLGEGMIWLAKRYSTWEDAFLYNAAENKWVGTDVAPNSNNRFYNGKLVCNIGWMENGHVIGILAKDGTYKEIPLSEDIDNYDKIYDGVFRALYDNGERDDIGRRETKYVFYDINGKLVVDLRNKDFILVGDHFVDGLNWVNITNSNGTVYTTLVNEKGEFQFEPVEGEALSFTGGVLKVKTHTGRLIDSDVTLYSTDGSVILNAEANSGIFIMNSFGDFVEGLSLVQAGKEVYFMDTAGKRVIG